MLGVSGGFTSNSSVFQDVPDKATQFFQHALRVAPDHTKSRLAMKVGLTPLPCIVCVHHGTAFVLLIYITLLLLPTPPLFSSLLSYSSLFSLLSYSSLFSSLLSYSSLFSLLSYSSLFSSLLSYSFSSLLSYSSLFSSLLSYSSLFSLPLLFQKSKSLLAKKEEGNRAFRSGENHRAYDIYSEALKIDPLNTFTNAKLFCNRALVGSKVSQHQVAIATRLLMFGP